jgi:hypothetical protein
VNGILIRQLKRQWIRRPSWLFFAIFGALVIATIRMIARNPFLSGQDFHYHLMSAALSAQSWTTHAYPSSLYHRVNPLDANTLLYLLLAPFELLLSPLRAFSFGVLLYYFIGFPLACLGALRLLRRPAWGALLAFPCSYVKSLFGFGFMPFVSAAPLFVLGLAAMHRVLARDSTVVRGERRLLALTAALFAATFLAHAHVYGWLMAISATVTVATIVRRLLPELVRGPARAVREALATGLRPLLVVAPSMVLAVAWSYRLRSGESAPLVPSTSTFQSKIEAILPHLIQTRGDDEWAYVATFFILVFLAFLLVRRAADFPSPEIAFVMTLASFVILPWHVNQQGLAPRQIDIAIWLLPLIVYPTAATANVRGRHAALVIAFAAFAAIRMQWVSEKLRGLQAEMAGLIALTKSCPSAPAEIAYVTSEMESTQMAGLALHQAHETFAALCRIDTPVYDTSKPAFRVAPLRYKGPLPAPITILVNRPNWFADDTIWRNFEYVLVYKWRASGATRAEASRRADQVGASGDWELWRRKPAGG